MRFPCHPRYATRARTAVEMLLEHLQLDEDTHASLMIAVGEAISGSVKYAQTGATFFELRVRVRGNNLRVDVENDGRAFDPQNPQLEDTRGFGMTIMRHFVDRVAFFRSGTIIRLEHTLAASATHRSAVG